MAGKLLDLRLAIGAPDHPKVERLCRTHGDTGFRCLVRLWCWVRENRPADGVLRGMDDTDIAIASRWDGDPESWVSSLSDCRLIDRTRNGKCWALHDWKENQPWAVGESKRVDAARKASQKRWNGPKRAKRPASAPDTDPDAERMRPGCGAESPLPSLSLPSPTNKKPPNPRKRGNTLLRRFKRNGSPPDGHPTWDAFFASEAMSQNVSAEEARDRWVAERETA